MANRLAASTSPYLLQHADNPVDWWAWGPEAFAEARRRDVPILLSVGYAACHWCHVMAHDSFERDDVAAVMNANFVNVKVDREERPDVDAVYMEATTALTGQGGWPMTCVLTPDGSPFYAGTFFPRAHFVQLLEAIAEAWRDRRDEVLAAGQRIVDALAQASEATPARGPAPDAAQLDAASARLVPQFDADNGGFGSAPKFPPSMVLEFLLRQHERTGDPAALAMAEQTFEAMARGGMYDQLAGGFARYTVDAHWVVPHFEKMLYDNALLLRAYVHWWRLTGSALAERIARETADFLLRDLGTAEGGFASALDADTEGVEGLHLRVDAGRSCARCSAPRRRRPPSCSASPRRGRSSTARPPCNCAPIRLMPSGGRSFGGCCSRRARRVRNRRATTRSSPPGTGLAIAALAEAGVAARRALPRRGRALRRACCSSTHLVDGRLRRTSRDGAVGDALGVAEDYGDLAEGLLVLHQATGAARWLEVAGDLLGVAAARFTDGQGGFYDTGDDAEVLVRRPRDPTDNATPSGSSALANALLTYSALTGSLVAPRAGRGRTAHRQRARRAAAAVPRLGVDRRAGPGSRTGAGGGGRRRRRPGAHGLAASAARGGGGVRRAGCAGRGAARRPSARARCGRRPTCAAAWSATCRSRRPQNSRPSSEADGGQFRPSVLSYH